MNSLDIIPKDILHKLILETTFLDNNLNKQDIKRYLYILNKNYFNERLKESFYDYFNNNIENKNDAEYQDFIKTVINPFFNEFIIEGDIPYTSIDEEYIINKIIGKYKLLNK